MVPIKILCVEFKGNMHLGWENGASLFLLVFG